MGKIRVHPEDWGRLEQGERDQILGILVNSGFVPTHQIEVSDAAEKVLPSDTELQALRADAAALGGIGGWFCRRACDVAEAAAVTACAALTNPIAVAVCIAAAHEAGKECRKRCG